MTKSTAHDDPLLGPLTDDRLTRDVRVWQRKKGHRFSSDDIATAYVASRECPAPKRHIDLGCGLGSVLLHLAWTWPQVTSVGIEAQAESFALLERNVLRNGLEQRVAIRHGDLRDVALLDAVGGDFDLVTGTPPYFPPGTALDADDRQRTFARMENRGGVEAYMSAAAHVVAPTGVVVLCGDSDADARVMATEAAARLFVTARVDVIPKAGKRALFSVWTLRRAPRTCPIAVTTMLLRDADGKPAEGARALRAFSGFEPLTR